MRSRDVTQTNAALSKRQFADILRTQGFSVELSAGIPCILCVADRIGILSEEIRMIAEAHDYNASWGIRAAQGHTDPAMPSESTISDSNSSNP